ncbi:Eco57I restriction-modification methylase domain-containing protein [Paenibacillus sp. p3-SID867]|uniref:Eco57I restriction-modification methylase domain-containing protein n=1 Tax=Paenibacillus sp. p3-SID867 TaxID=2916363 RepID=UPI0021A5C239|nr:Eco57I restriction-modification methylase domain-containing protein [Paenibacillus sp. p3-SID867]MCT1402498.1 Eco57I restriction-modification methylase domain-containing protein [Paenibacillus sp. p3-SID867]
MLINDIELPNIFNSIFNNIDTTRKQVSKETVKKVKSDLGQYFTEPQIALFMGGMFNNPVRHVKLLDPGAGIGMLTLAAIAHFCKIANKPISIEATVVEIDDKLLPYLIQSLEQCKQMCLTHNISFEFNIINEDFIDYGSSLIRNKSQPFNKVILNPPYKKINSNSKTRLTLKEIGIEASNLYAAFLSLSKRILITEGELVAITPRSFCNGSYFKLFRLDFVNDMSFRKIHIFDSRKDAFKDDDVLQENIIFLANKTYDYRPVLISSSSTISDPMSKTFLNYEELIHPNDPEKFIRILLDESDINVKSLMNKMSSTLDDLNLKVSTGKVVDFRTKENLRHDITEENKEVMPLIYPQHFSQGFIKWPIIPGVKPNGIILNNFTLKSLVPNGNYVLIRRFSSKEEKKRIVPAILEASKFDVNYIGLENHLNYYHINGQGLPLDLAKGLAIYLSSTIVDRFFRQFNGITQVNVGDLRSLPYPSYDQLIKLGSIMKDNFPSQHEIDKNIEKLIE